MEQKTATIKDRIETLRPLMVDMGMELGLTHPAVVKVSQAIDELHNELNRIEYPRKADKEVCDPSMLRKGDVVHYYGYSTAGGKLTSIEEKGTVQEDNLYKDGVDVKGDGWKQYVGKWFIFKVERTGRIIYEKQEEEVTNESEVRSN